MKLILAFALSLLTSLVSAQPAPGTNGLPNSELKGYQNGYYVRPVLNPTTQGATWYCSNWPDFNRACEFVAGKRLSILSVPAGVGSANSKIRKTYPMDPVWTAGFPLAYGGKYEFSATLTKTCALGANEHESQAFEFRVGANPTFYVPHGLLAPSQPVPVTHVVDLPAGYTYVTLGTLTRTVRGTYGCRYDYSAMSLQYKSAL